MKRSRGLGTTIADIAGAITRNEGACSSAGVCRNNNPGNLRAGPGSIGTDSRGFAIFPDFATGESALEHQISLNVSRGLSLDTFFGGSPGVYAGYDKTDPNYASKVAGWLGIPADVPLQSVLSGAGDGSVAGSGSDASTGLETANADVSGVDWSNPWLIGGISLLGGLILWSVAR